MKIRVIRGQKKESVEIRVIREIRGQKKLIRGPSTGSRMSEQDIIHGFGKVFYIGGKGMFLFGLQIIPFRLDDGLEVFGHIGIIGGNQSRFEFGAQILQIFGIETEIMFAEGTDPDQAEIALQKVDDLRPFIDPRLTEESAPAGDAKILKEFPPAIQPVLLEDIILQVFGVGVHGPEFIDIHHLTVVADTAQFDQGAVGRVFFQGRCFGPLGNKIEGIIDLFGGDNAEAAETKPAEDLRLGNGPVAAAGEDKIAFF